MMWVWSMLLNIGINALVNSPEETMLPIVSLQNLIRRPLPWKTVAYRLSSIRWSWWNAGWKSNLEKTLLPAIFAFIFSTFGIGRLVLFIALLTCLMSTVTLRLSLSLGASTILEIKGAGPVCGLIMPCFSVCLISLLKCFWKWKGIVLGSSTTGAMLGFRCNVSS